MDELEQLEKTITALEGQRTALGEDVVETALAPLRQRLAELQSGEKSEPVTVLAADLDDCTAPAERLDPRGIKEIITNGGFSLWTGSLAQFGGLIEELTGGAAMGEFGLPSAHEDDLENAARAASRRQPILVLCATRRALFGRWTEWGSAGELIKQLSRAGVPHEEDGTVDVDKSSQEGQVAAGYGLGNIALYLGSFIQSKDYLDRALSICRKIGNRQNEGWLLASLGQIGLLTRDYEAAREHCQGALAIAEQAGIPDQRGYALTYLGHAYLGLGKLDDSYRSFRKAAEIRQELELSGLLMDDLAGLARVELDRGELAQAQTYVEEILGYLSSHPSANMDEPARVYLTCLRILEATGDLRAQAIMEIGFAWLQERAAKIRGEAEQAAFLRNVPANREIVAEWEKRTYEE